VYHTPNRVKSIVHKFCLQELAYIVKGRHVQEVLPLLTIEILYDAVGELAAKMDSKVITAMLPGSGVHVVSMAFIVW